MKTPKPQYRPEIAPKFDAFDSSTERKLTGSAWFMAEPRDVAAQTVPAPVTEIDRSTHLTATAVAAIQSLSIRLDSITNADWSAGPITVAMKSTLAEFGLKMGQLAIPVRLLVFGQAQTPSVDAMLAAMPRSRVRERLANA